MLLITRRAGEKIIIGDDIVITVVEAGQTVRLGISAPKRLPIYREEVWAAVKSENQASADADVSALPPVSRAAK